MISEPTNSLEKERTRGERERERERERESDFAGGEGTTCRGHDVEDTLPVFLCGTFWKKILVYSLNF